MLCITCHVTRPPAGHPATAGRARAREGKPQRRDSPTQPSLQPLRFTPRGFQKADSVPHDGLDRHNAGSAGLAAVSEEDPCVGAGKITRDNGRRVTTTTARVAPLRSVPAIVVAGLPTATPTSRTAGSFGRALDINSIGFDQFERRHAAPRLQRGGVRR